MILIGRKLDLVDSKESKAKEMDNEEKILKNSYAVVRVCESIDLRDNGRRNGAEAGMSGGRERKPRIR